MSKCPATFGCFGLNIEDEKLRMQQRFSNPFGTVVNEKVADI